MRRWCIGAASIAYEGALDHPTPETLWQIVEEFRVTGIFTSPTAARLLMRYGEDITKKYDKSSVKKVFCAGEVLNAPAWEWLQKKVFDNHVPVIDHMWQTETGGPVFAQPVRHCDAAHQARLGDDSDAGDRSANCFARRRSRCRRTKRASWSLRARSPV